MSKPCWFPPYRLWLPLGHPLAQQEAIALEELAGRPMIQLMVDEIEKAPAAPWDRRPAGETEIAFRTRSVEAVRSLVATGAGPRSCPAWSIAPGRWKVTGSRSAMFRAICRRCRWVGLATGGTAVGACRQFHPFGAKLDPGTLTHRFFRKHPSPLRLRKQNPAAAWRQCRTTGFPAPMPRDHQGAFRMTFRMIQLAGTTALALLHRLFPALAQMTAIGAGEGELSIVAWASTRSNAARPHLI